MKEVITMLRWIAGAIFTLTGIALLIFAPVGGALFLILGVFLLPTTLNLFQRRRRIPRVAKYSIPFVLLTACIFATSKEVEAMEKEAKYKRLTEKSQSIRFAEELISAAHDTTFEKYKRGEYDTLFIEDPELNKNFIALLETNLHKRDSLLTERRLQKKRDSLNRIAQEAKMKELRRKESIEKQFSSWDGSHRNLEKLVKNNMKNPDSYEHVETRYQDIGDYLMVFMTYRGTNSFNAIVTNTTTAKVSLDGTVLEIVQ